MGDRMYGLDLYRVLCCLGVLTYHVMDDILGKSKWGGEYIIYFGASYCVPGFFLLSGFLLGKHQKITMDYIENKVTSMMKKLFAWIVLWSVFHFVRTGEIYDLWEQMTAGIVSGGILPVSWFLFTYCILLILGYPLWHLKNRYKKYFNIAAIIWGIMLAANIGRELISVKTQSMWLHLYIGYFILGMALTDILAWLERMLSKRISIIVTLSIFLFASAVYVCEFKSQYSYMAPHHYYGRWFYSLWLVSMFWLCTLVIFKNAMIQKMLYLVASDTMVVYLGHLPILLYVTNLHPLESINAAVRCIVFLFVLLLACAEGMKRLPLLRKIV